jgi:hypothetical protein
MAHAYKITVWKLSGPKDTIEAVRECECETRWQAIDLFDWITRGIQGHYKAWCVDTCTNVVLRESEFFYNRV